MEFLERLRRKQVFSSSLSIISLIFVTKILTRLRLLQQPIKWFRLVSKLLAINISTSTYNISSYHCVHIYLLCIQDCWPLTARDSNKKIVPDPAKFPDGISGVATQIHALGLKMGIYGLVLFSCTRIMRFYILLLSVTLVLPLVRATQDLLDMKQSMQQLLAHGELTI